MPDPTTSSPERAGAAKPAASAQILDIVLEHLVQGLAVIGPDFGLLAFNHRFEQIFRLPAGTFEIGRDFRVILRIWAECTGQDQEMLTRALRELESTEPFEFEFPHLIHGDRRWCLLTHSPLPGGGCVRTFTDITERKRITAELETNVHKLEQALAEVQDLRAILPICMYCKKVRDDDNYWSQLDSYLAKHAGTHFTHGICPECLSTHHPDLVEQPEPPPAPAS